MFEKIVKTIKMKIITDENLEIIGGFDVVEYEDGEIKYFDEFGDEIILNKTEI